MFIKGEKVTSQEKKGIKGGFMPEQGEGLCWKCKEKLIKAKELSFDDLDIILLYFGRTNLELYQ